MTNDNCNSERDECEKLYSPYREKYGFPTLLDLSKEFDINEFETDFILKEIVDKLKDKFDDASKVIETLFQPEGDFSSFIETKHFENDTKDEYFNAYKKLRSLVREAQILSYKNNETLDAKYISHSLKDWISLKPVVIELLERLKSCWTDDSSIDSVKYFG